MGKAEKTLLISGSNPDMTPFIEFYTNLFDAQGVDYDLLYWNRHGRMSNEDASRTIVYERKYENSYSRFRKIYEAYLFYRFCKKKIKNRNGKKYKKLICFTIMPFVFFDKFLKREYKSNYIFDIRDSSPILKINFFEKKIHRIIRNAGVCVISSEGFKEWLPKGVDYVLSHNIDGTLLRRSNVRHVCRKGGRLNILTIGYMLRFQPNDMIIDAFGNQKNVEMTFVGEGPASHPLQNYCKTKEIENVIFRGRYKKEDELVYYNDADMINILLSHTLNSDTCMSNRFYCSVLTRKPMIVNEGCYQASLVEKYNLGVVIKDYQQIRETVLAYWNDLNVEGYYHGCEMFLEKVSKDIVKFESKILNFCYSS